MQNQFLIPKFPWEDGKALQLCQKDQLLLIHNYFVHVFKNLLLRYQICKKKPSFVELLWLKCSCNSLKIATNVYLKEKFWLWIYGRNNWVTTDFERASWRGWICMACTWVLCNSTMKQWISLVSFLKSPFETVSAQIGQGWLVPWNSVKTTIQRHGAHTFVRKHHMSYNTLLYMYMFQYCTKITNDTNNVFINNFHNVLRIHLLDRIIE